MRVEDLPAVYNLGLRCYDVLDKPYNYWSVLEVAEHLEQEPGLCFVAVENGDIVGFALGAESYEILDETGHLEWVAVAPEQRRDGLATRLIDAFVEELRRRGRREVAADVSSANEAVQAGRLRRGDFRDVLHAPSRLRPRRSASHRACSARSAANGSTSGWLLRACAA
jgi:ribosomal protein S18 acetylase RimI-like enzyme